MQLQGVLDDKHNSIVLCKQAIKDSEAEAERLVKEIEEADKRRVKELEDKQAIINSMHGKVSHTCQPKEFIYKKIDNFPLGSRNCQFVKFRSMIIYWVLTQMFEYEVVV